MIERDVLTLLNAEIDGENSPEASARLQEHLRDNAEANAWYHYWRRVARAVRSAGFVEPPPGAIERACAMIPQQTSRASSEPGAGFPHWFARVFRKSSVRFASGFAMGAAVTAVLLVTVTREVDDPFIRSLDISDISGTIGSYDTARDYAPVGSVDAQLANVDAALQLDLHSNDDLLLAELDLHSSSPIECVLDHDGAGVSFEGFRSASGTSQNVIADQTEIRISHQGDGHYLLFYRRTPDAHPSVTIRIFAADELVFEDTVEASNP